MAVAPCGAPWAPRQDGIPRHPTQTRIDYFSHASAAHRGMPDSLCGTPTPVTGPRPRPRPPTDHTTMTSRHPLRDAVPRTGVPHRPSYHCHPTIWHSECFGGMLGRGMMIMEATRTEPQAGPLGDPRIGWSGTDTPPPPTLRHRRDGILPTIAAALSVRGHTLTGTAARGEKPPPCTPSSRTSSTPSPAPNATASPAAAPRPSSSPGTSPQPTPAAANAPPAAP